MDATTLLGFASSPWSPGHGEIGQTNPIRILSAFPCPPKHGPGMEKPPPAGVCVSIQVPGKVRGVGRMLACACKFPTGRILAPLQSPERPKPATASTTRYLIYRHGSGASRAEHPRAGSNRPTWPIAYAAAGSTVRAANQSFSDLPE